MYTTSRLLRLRQRDQIRCLSCVLGVIPVGAPGVLAASFGRQKLLANCRSPRGEDTAFDRCHFLFTFTLPSITLRHKSLSFLDCIKALAAILLSFVSLTSDSTTRYLTSNQ